MTLGSPASNCRHAADVVRLEFRLSQGPSNDELDFYFLERWAYVLNNPTQCPWSTEHISLRPPGNSTITHRGHEEGMQKAPGERTVSLEGSQMGMVLVRVFECRCDMRPGRKKDLPKSSKCGIAKKPLSPCHIQGMAKASEVQALSTVSGDCFYQWQGEK